MKKKIKKLNPYLLKKKIEGLLYKKNYSIERFKVFTYKINVYGNYYDALKKEINDCAGNYSELELLSLKREMYDLELEIKEEISQFKEFKRFYHDGLLEDIKKLMSQDEFNEIDFTEVEEMSKQLAERELYGKVEMVPDHIELPEILDFYDKYMKLLETEVELQKEKVESVTDQLEKTSLQKQIFDTTVHLATLAKRRENRQDYYVNTFLPQFKANKARCEQKLDFYLELANDVIKCGADNMMKIMVDMHEQHKDEEEKYVDFFIGLENRLEGIAHTFYKKEPRKPELQSLYHEFIK